ncbi:MAG: MFS transporter [Deltaproteobacteria bacterium]|nr:MFS transporter [Deltaproteobacteria bacterium]MBW2361726.1 MFS transporter [Deltaproteobacteria bacterium]
MKGGIGRSPRYVLAILLLVNTFNFVDRNIVSVLLNQIKADFSASDEQMGLLTGAVFMVVHSVMGIPLARWADRGTRRTVVAIGLAVWSTMTALSGFARSFGMLVFLRMGVGIGEASGAPASHSMISDSFAPEHRARALAIFGVGVYVGIMFGYLAAGWIGQALGWRLTFVVLGAPGLLLALLVGFTVPEPPRSAGAAAQPLRDVVAFLMQQRAYVWLLVAASCHAGSAYSVAIWSPTLLIRVHDFSLGEVGTALGLLTGIVGGAGGLLGGVWADRLSMADRRWYARLPALAAFASVPAVAGFALAGSPMAALFGFALLIFATGVYTGPLYAMNQFLAKPRMRAMSVAIHLFVVSIMGGGVGPWLVGRLSDTLAGDFGDLAIRYALLSVVAGGALIAGIFYLFASVTLRADVERAKNV